MTPSRSVIPRRRGSESAMAAIWCPRCGVHVSPRVSQTQEYVSVDVVEEHRDVRGRLRGTTTRPTQQVRTTRHLHCPQCGAALESTLTRAGRTVGNAVALVLLVALVLFIVTAGIGMLISSNRTAPPPAKAAYVVVTTDTENVRQKPGGKIVGKVRRGERLLVRLEPKASAGWVPVTCCGGSAGYIREASVEAAIEDTTKPQ